MTTIDIPVGETIVKTYIAMPEGTAPAPAVCVIHDALGMTQDARQQADWLANEGYLVAVPDLFDGKTLMGCLRSIFRDYMRGEGLLFDKVETVRQWLLQHERSTGKVGIIGFCFGGGFALLLAPRSDFDVASVNYGPLPKEAEDFLQGACPIVASYGGRDRSLKGVANQLETILAKVGVDHDVKEYPDAEHAFMNDHSQTKIPPILHVISFFAGGGDYHEASAEDARNRIVAFFEKYLKV